MNKKTFALLPLCLSAGIMSAVLSLVVASVLDPLLMIILSNEFINVLGMVTLEEVTKFLIIWSIFYLIAENLTLLKILSFSFFLALGFWVFELALIFIGPEAFNHSIFSIFIIHLLSFFLWLWAIHFLKNEKKLLLFFVFALTATIAHLLYNLFAMNNF